MQQFNSNADSSAVSDTSAMQDIQSDVVMHDISSQTGVSYRYRQLVEETRIVQSNDPYGVFSSAIWRLPTEILARIFLYCIPEEGNWVPSPDVAPLQLTRVCQRWREIAVDMPSLWCRLRLEVGDGNWQQRAFCYDSYLKRSRGSKLSLTLECHNSDWMELQSLLQPYVDQISRLSVGFFSGAGSLPMADFRGLSELVIYTGGAATVPAVMHSIAQLPPTMRSLKLMDLWCDLTVLHAVKDLGWASLINLEIVVDKLDSFVRLLALCPNLSSLTMIGMFTRIETSEAFAHPKLQYLRISGHLNLDSIVDLGLFNAVTLPNLRGIEVRNIGQWPHEQFNAFVTRSQCPLEALIFGGGVMTTDQQLAEYATLFPSLYLVKDPTRSKFYF
ncbi:uncharacterized protein EDB93DRAFT_252358 [Suillus bovinus]|uniref:uncharacterized protein n=1 Tax=Suillus bovinus TaxID=48563 RepID=UPI001B874D74|nr:uncharacterized protein EDB93DRAFT_252358 [Suillus bovinus]KAG2152568.1 hypothetical protein EDB93DRAFT_252358 [Suillus bovinus]